MRVLAKGDQDQLVGEGRMNSFSAAKRDTSYGAQTHTSIEVKQSDVSERGIDAGAFEYKHRAEKDKVDVEIANVFEFIQEKIG